MASSRSIAAILSSLDEATAQEAHAALDWLLPENGDADDLTEHEVLTFLLYALPRKWLTDKRHHHEVAWALGDFFAAAERPRLAGHCRATSTHLVIDTWESDPDAARRQMSRIMEASGVEPEDTSLLRWGTLQGPVEAFGFHQVSIALEAAIDDGRLRPGGRGWRRTAREITEQALLDPGPDQEQSLLDRILQERRTTWIAKARRRALPVTEGLADLLADPPSDLADQMAPSLEPLRWLLTQIGEGVRLTQAGYLPTALVRAAHERYEWFDLAPRFTVRGEQDLVQLSHLRELLEKRRLITKSRGRLTTSATGRRALTDDAVLIDAVLSFVFDERTWEGDAGFGVAAILLADDPEPISRGAVRQQLARYLGTHWHLQGHDPDTPLTADDLFGADIQFRVIGEALGWLDHRTGDFVTYPALTDVGRATAHLALVRSAHAPHHM